MKRWLGLISIATLVVACGGGGGGDPVGTTPQGTGGGSGSANGVVMDAKTGQRIQNAAISSDGKTTTTDANGEFTLSGLVAGTAVITIAATDYTTSYENAAIGASAAPVLSALKKEGARQNYSVSESKTIFETTTAGPYAVIFGANTLNTADTNLKVSVTPLDPTVEAAALPGVLATSNALLLPLTFAEFSIYDSSGNKVNLKPGAMAIVELPIPPELRSTYALGETIHCYSYNPVTGQWEDFVDGVVTKSSIDSTTPVVKASIKHFSWYGAAPESQNCVDVYGRVLSAVDGKPLAGARVEAFPGTVTTSDSNGDFIIRTTPDRSADIVATRTYIDTDGSVSGMPGAKVIDFGKLEDIPLVGLVSLPCSSPAVTVPSQTTQSGTTPSPLMLKIANIGRVGYTIIGYLTADGVFALLSEVLPDGSAGDPMGNATMTLSDGLGNSSDVPLVVADSGFFSLTTPIVAGRRYTLTIDLDKNGTVDGSGSVYAVGEVAWINPTEGASVAGEGLIASWSDTGASAQNYSALYSATISRAGDFSYYIGSDTQFSATSLLSATKILSPGIYTGTVTAFSGPYALASGTENIDSVNNVSGAAVNGQFYSFSSSPAEISFTVY